MNTEPIAIDKQKLESKEPVAISPEQAPVAPAIATSDADSLLPSSDLELIYHFTIDVIDKQYRSYVWNDGKVQALVTVDTGLIAGSLLILQVFGHVNALAFGLLALAFFSLIGSFMACLVHAIPRMNSGIGNEENLRTVVGISRLGKMEYHRKITGLSLSEMVRMNCWQISGMARNNLRSHKLIQSGVLLTIVGVLAIAIAISSIFFSSWYGSNNIVPQPSSIVSPPPSGVPTSTTAPILTPSPQPRPASEMLVSPILGTRYTVFRTGSIQKEMCMDLRENKLRLNV